MGMLIFFVVTSTLVVAGVFRLLRLKGKLTMADWSVNSAHESFLLNRTRLAEEFSMKLQSDIKLLEILLVFSIEIECSLRN